GICTTGDDQYDEITAAQQVQIYLDSAKDLVQLGNPLNLTYKIERRNDTGDQVIREGYADLQKLEMRETSNVRGFYLALIGLIYLGIGVYFLLKQGRGPYATHFFLLCLLAFIAHFYSATLEMRTQFDKAIDLADVVALILLAPLFVHFAASYPERHNFFSRQRWLAILIYSPALLLILAEVWLRFARLRELVPISSAVTARVLLSQIEITLFAASLVASTGLMLRKFRQTRSIIARQQLKWVTLGMGVASLAFAVFYVPSYLVTSSVSPLLESISLAPLVLIPLTMGYSIVRYKLTDVDVVMRRSFAYV